MVPWEGLREEGRAARSMAGSLLPPRAVAAVGSCGAGEVTRAGAVTAPWGLAKPPALCGGVLAGDLVSTLSPDLTCRGAWLASSSAFLLCGFVLLSSVLQMFCGIPGGINVRGRALFRTHSCRVAGVLPPAVTRFRKSQLGTALIIGPSLLTCVCAINDPSRNSSV